ncbi:hypothetical protein EJ04DRAFT_3612 [Polyplosphaeria fusca]|uniref:Uncharacterized protein n=1 Tax=Polyplosphaeria fusca TaxID=682080 RepID=A0A9P4V993_9PLEO|nr:hypothetical protein EJ04DRAFT_3612 [Polyplosphaeria fusca]
MASLPQDVFADAGDDAFHRPLPVAAHSCGLHIDDLRDQHAIQPTTPFRRHEKTNATTYAEPLTPFHQSRLSGPCNLQHVPHADSPRLSIAPDPPGHDMQTSPLRTPSSTRIANVGIRRSHHASILLGSPARPGHTKRMNQIFADSSRENKTPQCAQNISYPPLPDISDHYEPATWIQEQNRSSEGKIINLQQGCLLPPGLAQSAASAKQPRNALPGSLMGDSSGSWSGDSSYLTVDAGPRTHFPVALTQPRVEDWLSSLSLSTNTPHGDISLSDARHRDHSTDSSDGGDFTTCHEQLSPHLVDRPHFGSRSSGSSSLASQIDLSFKHDDGLLAQSEAHEDGTAAATKVCSSPETPLRTRLRQPSSIALHGEEEPDDGGIELSPLSPNVCVERGPSRYRPDHGKIAETARQALCSTPPNKGGTCEATVSQSAKTLRALGNAQHSIRFRGPDQSSQFSASNLSTKDAGGVKLWGASQMWK